MQGRYAYPAGAYFCSCKSRQNTLGAVPQDPLTLKLRLDTNDALASSVRRRRYALKVPAAHFILDSAETGLNAPAAPYKRRLIPLRECAALPGGVYRRVRVFRAEP